MLIFLRRLGDKLTIDKGKIAITILGTKNDSILLGIQAPPYVKVDRQEACGRKQTTERFCENFMKSLQERKP